MEDLLAVWRTAKLYSKKKYGLYSKHNFGHVAIGVVAPLWVLYIFLEYDWSVYENLIRKKERERERERECAQSFFNVERR